MRVGGRTRRFRPTARQHLAVKEASSSFLKKRTKKLLNHFGPTGAGRLNIDKGFLLLF
jgi:hypothetical protein